MEEQTQKRTYMLLPTPSKALVSMVVGENGQVSDVLEFDGTGWTPDEQHGDILQTAGNIGALRKLGIFLDEEDVQIMMEDKKSQHETTEEEVK